ncbi:sugar phosphate isomerase/epimerase family protein [Terrimonas pollutisoli]|uniref:sugar phosphate isomerase/epimerase family protein n=1 Tax=Terrimonas pollutisoli TaxID=3034147 RepID=UPI0023EDFCFE|nr:sugar phosphate isomerase/epimerase [Terrimonas sp. H1YJ31]
MQRKKFLQLGGLGALGAAITPSTLFSGLTEATGQKKPAKIAVQLYSVRKEIEKDIRGTLKRIADIGFEAVETAFWPDGVSVQQAGQYLKEAGLPVCSAHIELPIGDKKAAFLETAKAMGCKKMIWHGWPEDIRYGSLAGTKQLVTVYNDANRFAKANGLQFGIHNHWWEFRNKAGKRFVYEVLLEMLDKDIFFEIDTYWVKVAGQNPAAIVKKFGKRAPMLHIKDGPAIWRDSLADDHPDPMVAVGKGAQNFPAIVKAAAGNTEWMIVEMDKTTGDVFEALKESYDYLLKNGMATGRIAV